jgi:fermentation-respiration switch protein FrsA (DUF1100 family)
MTIVEQGGARRSLLRRVLGWSLVVLILIVSAAGYFVWRWIDGIADSAIRPIRATQEIDFLGRTIPQDGPPPGLLGALTSTLDEGGERVWRVAGPPAATMGIRYGDILVEWNGTTLDETGEAYRRLLQDARAGDAMTLRVRRPEDDRVAPLEMQGTLSPRYRNPSDLNLEYENLEFSNPEGMNLRGWYIPASGDRGVVFAHGNAGNRASSLNALRAFHDAGYHAIQFDFSGPGDSDGDFITYGLREAGDLVAAVTELTRKSGVPPTRVVLYGRSMGAATSLLAAAETEVGAVVSVAAYADLYDVLRSWFGALPTEIVPRLVTSAIRRKGGFDVRQVRPVDAVPKIRAPILYVHGQADRLIPREHMERLAAVTVAPHETLMIPEMDHADPSRFVGDSFVEGVLSFLDENGLASTQTPEE